MKLQHIYSILITLSVSFFIGCGSAPNSDAKIARTSSLIESGKFEIQHDWLTSQGGGRVNILDNPNFIRFKNDSVNLFLPFFGERFSGGGYNLEGGFIYEGPLNNYEIEEDKNRRIIKFRTKQNSEIIDFTVNIFPEGNVTTRVNSSERSFISYQGDIRKLRVQD
ncbi:DUF4251 domain-containing protein [Salegentibacter sp. Hel_I_6]|uniref:DUF4251 domain-containing protein n=1 Tax=Salegentibacter sp. Hel_I_6 TaxID=1250278 RepID=UPI00068D7B23|nr:DUF4251 domain-containing protein [Salegentibacter sp. Hel_I_6]